MFGVVPKPLWERRIPPTSAIGFSSACAACSIEHDIGLVLIDTGRRQQGEREVLRHLRDRESRARSDPRARGRIGVGSGQRPRTSRWSSTAICTSTTPAATRLAVADGVMRPTFPNARYVMQRGEYEYATHTNERTAASYFPHNFVPVAESGQLEFDRRRPRDRRRHSLRVDARAHAVPPGSARSSRTASARSTSPTWRPTAAHLPLAWIMGYDVEPLVTLETKRRILERAVDEKLAGRLRARSRRRPGVGWRTTARRTGSPLLARNTPPSGLSFSGHR